MARRTRIAAITVVAMLVFFASFYHNLFHSGPIISGEFFREQPSVRLYPQPNVNFAVGEHHEEQEDEESTRQSSRHVTSVSESISSVSILLPAWEVLVIISPETPVTGEYTCLFPNNDPSPAKPAGFLRSPDRATFKCDFPEGLRRRWPFRQPILTKSVDNPPAAVSLPPELLRWNFLVYDSLSTENDVILFVKGLNNRQGSNREPNEFRCVFGDDVINGAKTAVTSSMQEVFRCQRPELKVLSNPGWDEGEAIKISLEIPEQNLVVPSVAYYTPSHKIASEKSKSLLCACTMVYNVAKFLKEWVMYHSAIGVEKFFLYDNGSDDDLEIVIADLSRRGYNVSTMLWQWQKTQEAGFSHCAITAKDSCKWMMYVDVDEFVYSPNWADSSNPSHHMLKSLLPKSSSKMGQVTISCYEFGPSNQKSHPLTGVTQGYNCRRRSDNRHKSIVLLDAINDSLLNVVHHFQLKGGYRVKKLNMKTAVVNHYKFQAWSEFKAKFRRRVSAYVSDWTKAVNPASKDRTPGLGNVAVEPRGWPEKFCEVYDERLKDLTQTWFGVESPYGYRMAWQR